MTKINSFTRTARVGIPAVFSCKYPVSHFKAGFSAFPGLGGISYRPAAKSVLNRIFGENNFLCKNYGKTFGN